MDLPRLLCVGCGSHATHNILPALAYAGCRPDALCDLDRGLAERTAARHGFAAVGTDWRRLLDERRPDGVVVVGPPSLHVAVAEAALDRGIPVFTEKPTAPDLATLARLVALAEARGTFLMTGFMKRFGTPYRHLQELIAAGRFEPSQAWIRYGHWSARQLEGMLLTMSIHAIDLAIALVGAPDAVASACVGAARGALGLALTLRCPGDRIAQLTLDSAQPRIQERVEVSGRLDGQAALAVVDNVQHLEIHRQGRNGIDLVACDAEGRWTTPSPDAIAPVFDLADIQVWRPDFGIPNLGQSRLYFQGYIGELREFTAAVRERRPARPSNRALLPTMRVIDAVLRRPDGETRLVEAPIAASDPGQASARPSGAPDRPNGTQTG